MVALSVQAERLRAYAAAHGGPVPRAGAPVGEADVAKRRLRWEGQCLQADLDMLWLPLARAAQDHPWRTLSMATGSGLATAWLDDASDGRLHRLALRGFWPLLRTLIVGAGLKGP